MITKKQLEVFRAFKNDFSKRFSFSELKKELKESSSSKLQNTIKAFKEEELIKISEFGKTKMIYLNFDNNKLFYYLEIFQLEYFKSIPFEVLYRIQEEILKETEFFSLIVFGSYAVGGQRKDSDLDVCIIVENSEIKKRIMPRIASVKRKEIKEINEMVFSKNEFLEMLKSEDENAGKEIARKHFVFYGMINFYKLILGMGKWKG